MLFDQYVFEWFGIKVVEVLKFEEEVLVKGVDMFVEKVKEVDIFVYGFDSLD